MGRKGQRSGMEGTGAAAPQPRFVPSPRLGTRFCTFPGAAGAAAAPGLSLQLTLRLLLGADGSCFVCVGFCLFLNISPESRFPAGRVCICWLFLCTALRR